MSGFNIAIAPPTGVAEVEVPVLFSFRNTQRMINTAAT
jgi:hypothetical protein